MESGNGIKQIIQEAEITDTYDKATEKESDLEKQLLDIQQHYLKSVGGYYTSCKSTAQELLTEILEDKNLKDIHSARYRIKTFDSLAVKYIKKKAMLPDMPGTNYNIEKYRPMTAKNYYKIITDLIGLRILIRYQRQWETVHEWIWGNFFQGEDSYIQNWLTDYPTDATAPFIVEKPKLYLRNLNDLPVYEIFEKNTFEHLNSKEGYNSIHYLLWFAGKYVEIQVRTIYDEAWGECTHDLVYKCKQKSLRNDLEDLSKCLAIQTQAASMITDMMYEKAQSPSNHGKKQAHAPKPKEEKAQTANFDSLQKRIQSMNNSGTGHGEFDGTIDNLI